MLYVEVTVAFFFLVLAVVYPLPFYLLLERTSSTNAKPREDSGWRDGGWEG